MAAVTDITITPSLPWVRYAALVLPAHVPATIIPAVAAAVVATTDATTAVAVTTAVAAVTRQTEAPTLFLTRPAVL